MHNDDLCRRRRLYHSLSLDSLLNRLSFSTRVLSHQNLETRGWHMLQNRNGSVSLTTGVWYVQLLNNFINPSRNVPESISLDEGTSKSSQTPAQPVFCCITLPLRPQFCRRCGRSSVSTNTPLDSLGARHCAPRPKSAPSEDNEHSRFPRQRDRV